MTAPDDTPDTTTRGHTGAPDNAPWPETRVDTWWHLPFPDPVSAAPAYDELIDLWEEVPRLRGVATRLATRSASAPDALLRRIDATGSTVEPDPDTALAAAARAARTGGPAALFTWHGLGLGFVDNPRTTRPPEGRRRRHIPGPLLLLRADQYEASASLSPHRLDEPGYVRREVEQALRSIHDNRWTPGSAMPDLAPPQALPRPGVDLDRDPGALELIRLAADAQQHEPCLYDIDGRCVTHGRRELFGVCQTTVARELLRRQGHLPLDVPAVPMTVLANRLRDAAVAVELAMTPRERGRMRREHLEETSGFDGWPVCALIAAAVARDPLDWLMPQDDGAPTRDFRVRWPAFAAAHLSDQRFPAAWRLAAVVGTAYMLGHTPQADDVLDLARRAACALRTSTDSDEATRLFMAYDRFAASEYPRPGGYNGELDHVLDRRTTTPATGETSP